VLDLRYQMAPSQSEGQARVQTTFYPPRLKGNVFQGRVRWYVGLPANWVPVHVADQVAVEQRWGFRGWVPAPRAAVSAAELERWFTANPDLRGTGTEGSPEIGTRSSEVVCWQANLAPLVLSHTTESLWWLTCSLAFLILGLGLYFTASAPRLFGALVLLL